MLILDSGKRSLERGPDYRLEPPDLVLGIILGAQPFLSRYV